MTVDNGMAMGMGMGMPTAASMLSMEAIGQGASGAVGGELCGKPYRWDQRLFAVILGGAGGGGEGGTGMGVGRVDGGRVPAETVMALRSVCEETGGCLATWDAEDGPKHKTLASHVNDLLGNVHKKGPVVMFRADDSLGGGGGLADEYDDDLDGGFNAIHRPPVARAGLSMRSGATCSFWPIPEPFWVDRTVDPLPPRREAQPELVFRKTGSAAAAAAGTATTSLRGDLTHPRENDGLVQDSSNDDVPRTDRTIPGFAASVWSERLIPDKATVLLEKLGVGVDQYELEWCGSGTRLDIPRSETWQLFVKDTSQPPSPDSTPPPAFGYLRASLTTGRPLMMVLPYNYEVLIPLLQAVQQATQSTAPPAAGSPWARDFMAYIKGVPTYYLPSLQRVLQVSKKLFHVLEL
ncbi:unnamed protein product [Ectocarpus sp. CCAP 1310/34]|nr:unnamed protein product [Ectocarpus sp. CCAP 1310/34]